MARETVEDSGEDSIIEAKEEGKTKGEEREDTWKQSWLTRTKKRPLDLANRRTWPRERSQSDGAGSQITKGAGMSVR